MIWASETCLEAIITFLTTQVPLEPLGSLPANPPNGMCVLKIWHVSQGLRSSRGTVDLCLDCFWRVLGRTTAFDSFFFSPKKTNATDLECAAQYRIISCNTQLTCNMMQKWALCFNIVFWSKRLYGARAKVLAWINCNPWENNEDISGLL